METTGNPGASHRTTHVALPSAQLSRRRTLQRMLGLGLATPAISAFLAGADSERGVPSTRAALRAAQPQPDADRLTVVALNTSFDLDPHTSYSWASLIFLGVYEMLVQLKSNRTDEVEPMLAESWEVSDDQSTYTFRLAPDTVFHDGSTCDASAVKASFTRLLELAAPPAQIVGRFVQDPSQIVVLDDQTIRFDLGRPQPLFLVALASPFGPYVVNPRLIDAHKTADDPWAHEWFTSNTAGAGTGPYVAAEDLPGERTVLRRSDNYHRGWAGDHFAEVVLRVAGENATRRQLLERGEADVLTSLLTPEDVAALEEMPALHVSTHDSFEVTWMPMNAPRLRTLDVRRGFCFAFPYDEVIAGAHGGRLKRTGPLPAGMRGYDPNVFLYRTDLARAKELILSGGFHEGDVFDCLFDAGDASSRVVVQLFQANLRAIGFDLQLIEVDQAGLFDVMFGGLSAEERPHFIGSWGWQPDYDDPWNQLAPSFLRPIAEGGEGTVNVSFWWNARLEHIMAEAKTYTDEGRLAELMKEARNILTEQDPPCIYLGQRQHVTVLADDIHGYDGNPLYLNFYRFFRMYRALM